MKYMGSKSRIAKSIIPIILKNYEQGMIFIDACVGGANIIDSIPQEIPKYGNDNNKYLIALYKGIQENRLGDYEIDKEYYGLVRDVYNGKEIRFEHIMNIDDFTIGWVGFMASANGRFFEGGYSGISKTKTGSERNYIDESIRGLTKQIPKLRDVVFSNKDILEINPTKKALIYCDIPYKGTKQYSTSKNFDYNAFYDWCRLMKQKGHQIFISEYNMPDDFICVWQQEVKSSLSANGISGGNKVSVEKLFTI